MTQFAKVTSVLIFSLMLQACNQGSAGGSSEAPSTTPNPDQNQCSADLAEPFYFEDADYSAQASVTLNADSLRSRMVKVNIEALKSALQAGKSRIRLDLFNGLNLSVIAERIQKFSNDNYVLTGRIENEALSSVSIAIEENVLVANINPGQESRYVVTYRGNDVHSVEEFTTHEHDDEGNCLAEETNGASLMEPGDEQIEEEENSAMVVQNPVIDMLVVYTPGARTSAGGDAAMKALIQTGISDTNKSFSDSGVNLSVRLVGTMLLKQNETGAWSSDLSALSGKTDGRWDEVHAERIRLGADQVSLAAVYSGSSTAGIGYIKASASKAFSITKISAFKNFSFTHELGHNVGLNHSDGYVNNNGSFRTIMAYGTVTRIARFSNPLIPYRTYVTGTASKNSSKILNANGTAISNLVAAIVPVSTPDIPVQPLPPEPSNPNNPGQPNCP